MKKLSMVWIAALLLLSMSCKKTEIENGTENDSSVIRVYTETPDGDGKTHLDGLAVKWDVDDKIWIFGQTGSYAYKYGSFSAQNIGPNGRYAEFRNDESVIFNKSYKTHEACYPATEEWFTVNNKRLQSNINLSALQNQTYKAGTFFQNFFPMLSRTTTINTTSPFLPKELYFKNLCGMLAIELKGEVESKGDVTVEKIVLTSKNTNDKLWGTGTFSMSGNDSEMVPSISLTEGGNSVTLTCDPPVTLSTTPTTFYFVLPPNTLTNGFDIQVTGNGWSLERSNSGNNTIHRNKIREMPELTCFVETKKNLYPDGLPGSFTVGMDSNGNPIKVNFSQGNLQFHTTSELWQFAPNQWVSCDFDVRNYASKTNKWIDLFGWGTSNNDYGAEYYQPWTIKYNEDDNLKYGPAPNSGNPNLSVTVGSDWGANSISNSNVSGWRTLSMPEWIYLIGFDKFRIKYGSNAFSHRTNAENLYGEGKITINNQTICGLIILPDGWMTCPEGVDEFIPNTPHYPNEYTLAQWRKMEQAGAVFLPATGYRVSAGHMYFNEAGYYWTTSYGDEYWPYNGTFRYFNEGSSHYAQYMFFDNNIYDGAYNYPYAYARNFRYFGCSVRLVRNVTN